MPNVLATFLFPLLLLFFKIFCESVCIMWNLPVVFLVFLINWLQLCIRFPNYSEAGTLQGVKALLSGLRTLHTLIPPYPGTSFMVRWTLESIYVICSVYFNHGLTLAISGSPGSGMITQDIYKSASYYVAVGNLNTEEVEVILQTCNLFYYNLLVWYVSNWIYCRTFTMIRTRIHYKPIMKRFCLSEVILCYNWKLKSTN